MLVNAAGEHIAAELVPVSGFFPQRAVEDLRSLHLFVAVFAQFAAHIVLDFAVNDPTLGVPEHHSRRFFLQVEEIQLFADFTVIAFFRFCLLLQIGIQRFLIGEGDTVNALQRFTARVATPVRAGQLRQFERLDVPHMRHMRAATHIEVFLMVIQANLLDAVVKIIDQAHFEILVAIGECLTRLGNRRPHLINRIARCRQFLHPLFQHFQIFRGEAVAAVNVVVEAVFNHRPDDHLRFRPQLLQRVPEQVRG